MALEPQSAFPWYQGAAELFRRLGGRTIVEVVSRPVMIAGGNGESPCSSVSLWCRYAEHVFAVGTQRAATGEPQEAAASAGAVTVVAEDPLGFLGNCDRPIDLLYLDGWAVGTPEYKQRHLEAYLAAQSRLHDRTLILIGETARDHGGKAGRVLPRALEDGFQVLLWGSLTLLGQGDPAALRGVLPRVGPPVPSEATLDDAVRMHQAGLLWEAGHLYGTILKKWPDNTAALHLLGVVRHQQGDHAAALKSIGRAIALDPTKAVFFNNYGAALHGIGRSVEALACFYRALQLQPEYADALSNLGLAQTALGQDEAAGASYRRVLELRPDHFDTLKRLGELLQKQGQDAQAIELYRHAVAERPHPELCLQLGNLLAMAGRTDLAVAQYQKATELNPDLADAWFNQGVSQLDQRRVPEGRDCFARAVALRPEKSFWRLRQATVGPLIFRDVAEIEAYRAKLSQVLDEWLAAPPPAATWNELLFADAIPVFNLAYHGCCNRELKQRIAAVYEPYFRELPDPPGSGGQRRRRIGFVVTRRHEGIFMRCMKGILEQLSREEFEIIVFCAGGALEQLRADIRRDDIRYTAIPHTLAGVVETIRAAACDLIYHWEVGSDSLNYLLPFARLAPVQCTSHGSLVTTGVPAIQYFLSSELIESPDAAEHYSERLWKLQSPLMRQTRLPEVSPVTRDYFRLPSERNLYVCFQNPLKLHPQIDFLLRDILAGDPQGLVVLLGGRHKEVGRMLQERFTQSIPQAWQRIMVLPWLKFDDYCRLLQLADVVLDPPHYTAGSSAYDMFSFHQPIVTMPGELAVSRVTAGYYARMEIEDLVAKSAEDYVNIAIRVATDRDYRLHLRDRLRLSSAVLFDDLEVVREHERFFREVLA